MFNNQPSSVLKLFLLPFFSCEESSFNGKTQNFILFLSCQLWGIKTLNNENGKEEDKELKILWEMNCNKILHIVSFIPQNLYKGRINNKVRRKKVLLFFIWWFMIFETNLYKSAINHNAWELYEYFRIYACIK